MARRMGDLLTTTLLYVNATSTLALATLQGITTKLAARAAKASAKAKEVSKRRIGRASPRRTPGPDGQGPQYPVPEVGHGGPEPHLPPIQCTPPLVASPIIGMKSPRPAPGGFSTPHGPKMSNVKREPSSRLPSQFPPRIGLGSTG